MPFILYGTIEIMIIKSDISGIWTLTAALINLWLIIKKITME